MESSFVSTNFEYYGGIQNLEYEALYQGIILATLLMRGSRQYNSSFTKEGSSSPRPQPPRVSEPQSLSAPQALRPPLWAPASLAPGPQLRPSGPQSPFESSCPPGMDGNSSPCSIGHHPLWIRCSAQN